MEKFIQVIYYVLYVVMTLTGLYIIEFLMTWGVCFQPERYTIGGWLMQTLLTTLAILGGIVMRYEETRQNVPC